MTSNLTLNACIVVKTSKNTHLFTLDSEENANPLNLVLICREVAYKGLSRTKHVSFTSP